MTPVAGEEDRKTGPQNDTFWKLFGDLSTFPKHQNLLFWDLRAFFWNLDQNLLISRFLVLEMLVLLGSKKALGSV